MICTTSVREFSKWKLCLFIPPTFAKNVLARCSNHLFKFNVLSPTEFNRLWNQVCVRLNSGKYAQRACCYFYYHIWVKKPQRIENRKIKCTEMASWGGGQGEADINFILAARGKKEKDCQIPTQLIYKIKFLFYPLGCKLEPEGEIFPAIKNERKPEHAGIQGEICTHTKLTINPFPNYTEMNYNHLKIWSSYSWFKFIKWFSQVISMFCGPYHHSWAAHNSL